MILPTSVITLLATLQRESQLASENLLFVEKKDNFFVLSLWWLLDFRAGKILPTRTKIDAAR